MTTEDDFQAALDAHPEDWQTRQVFADWLEDNARSVCWRCEGVGKNAVQWGRGPDDFIDMTCTSCKGSGAGDKSDGRRERAEGYRALGALRVRPKRSALGKWYWYTMRPEHPVSDVHRHLHTSTLPNDWWETMLPQQAPFETRREAEDAAALAFAKLPAARRAELLTSPAPA